MTDESDLPKWKKYNMVKNVKARKFGTHYEVMYEDGDRDTMTHTEFEASYKQSK